MSEPTTAAAVGVSVVANLEGDRQVTLQTFFPQDASTAERNGVIDALMADVDRQKAKYGLTKLREDLVQNVKLLDRAEADLAEVDANYAAAQEGLAKQAAQAKQRGEAVRERGYNSHTASGRTGDYKPSGHVLSEINAANKEAEACVAQMDKNTAERDQHRGNVLVSISRYKEEIDRLNVRIAEAEKAAT